MKSKSFVHILLSAMIILPVHTIQAYSFKPQQKKEVPRFAPKKPQQVHNHEIEMADDCCDATKHKKDCTTQKICSIISKLNMIKSQVSTIDTAIDEGFANVDAELDAIAEVQELQSSKLDECCASLNSKLDVLITESCDVSLVISAVDQCCSFLLAGLDAANANIETVSSKLDQCCDGINSSLDSINIDVLQCCATLNSKIDSLIIQGCDVTPVISSVDQCCTLLIAGLNAANANIETVSSKLDQCCEGINSSLESIDLEISECCSTLNSKIDALVINGCDVSPVISSIDQCCEGINSSLESIDLEIGECCSTLNSKLDFIDNELIECCSTLNSKIDAIVINGCDVSTLNSKLDTCCLQLNSSLDSIDTEIAECCSTLNSKLDSIDNELVECCSSIHSKLDAFITGLTVTCDLATVSSKIDLCCSTLNSKIDDIDFGVNSRIELCCTLLSSEIQNANACCLTISSKLDFIVSRTGGGGGSSCMCTFTCNCSGGSSLCAPTPITSSTTINSSGSYCLSQDIFSTNAETILINASNVVLDLNAHNVDNSSTTTNQAAIRTNPFQNNIVVKNGSIKHNGGTSGLGMGVHLNGSTIISLENISVGGAPGGNFGWATGIQNDSGRVTIIDSTITLNFVGLNSTLGLLRLERCNFQGSQGDGATIQQGPIFIKDCYFAQAGQTVTSSGLHLFGANNVAVYDCHFNGNLTMASSGVFIEGSSSVAFYDCVASDNRLYGFNLGSSTFLATNVLLSNCYACNNSPFEAGVGFNVTAGRNCNLINCVAKNNNTGFFVADAFLPTQGIIRGCTADGNANAGFSNLSATTSYFSNVACNNVTNYAGVSSAQVTSSMNAKAFENVDCSNTTPDIGQSKLDACCFATQSKLDILLSL